MLTISQEARVYLALGATDMRKAINGLSILVEQELGGDLFCGDLFGFCNRGRNIVKILYWNRNGFSLWQKRLEKDRFKWPDSEAELMEVGLRELEWLLDVYSGYPYDIGMGTGRVVHNARPIYGLNPWVGPTQTQSAKTRQTPPTNLRHVICLFVPPTWGKGVFMPCHET